MLAHVDGAKGFEVEVPGNAPHHKTDVIKHKSLLGIEMKHSTSAISYSDLDPDSGRKLMGAQRAAALGLGSRQFLARVVNSDAHTLATVGNNPGGANRVTRYKMQSPSFSALKTAMLDSDVRVRIEARISVRRAAHRRHSHGRWLRLGDDNSSQQESELHYRRPGDMASPQLWKLFGALRQMAGKLIWLTPRFGRPK